MRGRVRLLLLGLVTVLVAGGCQLRINVAVDVNDDGSGVIRVAVGLDDDAVSRVPDLANQLELGDLVEAGWDISGPALESDGYTWIRASKRFATPEQATSIMEEISGPEGPFRDFRVERRDGFLKSTYDFTGTIDLSAGVEGFSDDALRERLDGTSFGVDPAEIEEMAQAALDEIFVFRVAALLPGEVESNAPVAVSGGAVWQPRLGEQATFRATGERWNIVPIALAVVAVLAGVALLAVLAVRARRWRRARRAAPPSVAPPPAAVEPSHVTPPVAAPVPAEEPPPAEAKATAQPPTEPTPEADDAATALEPDPAPSEAEQAEGSDSSDS